MSKLKQVFKSFFKWVESLFSKTKTPNNEKPLATCGIFIADQKELDKLEKAIDVAARSGQKSSGSDLIIPLVFHVLHKGEPIGTGTNISDEQIYSSINALNEDYLKEPNSIGDGEGASTPFKFILANKDDQGNPTTGIYRFNGAEASQGYSEEGVYYNGQGISESIYKNWSRQNNQHAYNVWIVSEIGGNNGGSGVQGFAYFPTTSYVDGIVQLYNATGIRPNDVPFGTLPNFILKSYTKLNKTLTHEMGHAMALFHTFQGNSCSESNSELQGDRVSDTPPTVKNSNGNFPACGGTQQVENYMDYCQEYFKNMFTQGQVDRMVLAAENSRPNLLNSNALDNLQTIEATATMNIVSPNEIVCPETENYLKILVTNTSSNPIHKIRFAYTIGQTEYVKDWYGAISPQGVYGNDTIGLERLSLTENETDISVSITHINDNPYDVYDSAKVIVPTNEPYRIEINQDILAGQISWDITRVSDMQVIYQSPDYNNFNPNEIIQHNLCLPDGYYNFTLIDVQAGMQTEGAYIRLLDPQGNILLNAADGFSQLEKQFFVGKKSPDLNNDGMVNIADISKMMLHFGTVLGDPNFDPKVDLNSDDQINILDLSILLKDFNTEIESKKVH